MPGRRRVLRLVARAGLAGLVCATLSFGRKAAAARSVSTRLLCSGPAGSIPDLVARTIGEQLGIASNASVVVENRPGAAGQISVQALKAAAPHGSTLLLAQGAVATVHPFVYSRLAYDPLVDLQPVSLACEMSLALAVGPAVPHDVTTLAEFFAWLRIDPARASIGSPGAGTLPHLLEAMLFREAGVTWQHISYSGGPPALTDLLGGRIAALVLPEGLLRQHHASGRARVLATSGAARSNYLPDTPCFVELGHASLVMKEWFAFFAAATMPKLRVEQASAELRDAIARSNVAAVFAEAGMTAASSSPAALAARISAEQRFWQSVIRSHGIHAD